MDEFQAFLKQFTALDVTLYPVGVTLAVLLRFCRAYWLGFGDRSTLAAALIMGAGGAALASGDDPSGSRPLFWVVVQGASLVVTVLVAELGTRKVPFLPKDNALIHMKDNPPPPGP